METVRTHVHVRTVHVHAQKRIGTRSHGTHTHGCTHARICKKTLGRHIVHACDRSTRDRFGQELDLPTPVPINLRIGTCEDECSQVCPSDAWCCCKQVQDSGQYDLVVKETAPAGEHSVEVMAEGKHLRFDEGNGGLEDTATLIVRPKPRPQTTCPNFTVTADSGSQLNSSIPNTVPIKDHSTIRVKLQDPDTADAKVRLTPTQCVREVPFRDDATAPLNISTIGEFSLELVGHGQACSLIRNLSCTLHLRNRTCAHAG